MIKDNVFCALPWNQVMVSPSGDYKVCCFSGDHTIGSHGYCLDDNGKPMNVLTHSFEEAMQSKTTREIREAQLKGEKHPQCSYCWSRGDSVKGKDPSFRHLRTNVHFKSWGINTEKARSGESDSVIRSLDLRFTNVCNLKCIMCSPLYSSAWYDDYYALYNTDTFGDANVRYKITKINSVSHSDMPRWHDTDIWKSRFDSVKYGLQHIYVTGGEPFIIKGHLDLLDDLIECDLAKNIVMDYDTNLTVINTKILSRLAKFKHVRLCVSLDDIGDRYNYYRYPGKFVDTFANLTYLLREKSENIEVVSLSSCVGILNVFAPIRFASFLDAHSLTQKLAARLLRSPDHFDIKYLPRAQKTSVLAVYENDPGLRFGKSLVVDYLKAHMDELEAECVSKTIAHTQFLDKLDALRGTDWKSTFPETASLLKHYIQ